jgi:hypothetical protein
MEYSIRYNDENKIVEIKSTGRMNFKTAEQYSKDAIKVAHEHRCSKFLIDHFDTDLSVNIHATGEELQQFGFQITDKIAIVIKNGHSSLTVSQNSRWSESKYFDNIEEAVTWLVTDK